MNLAWNDITKEELKKIFYRKKSSDDQIAEKYGVATEKVTYKRNIIGISIEDKVYEEFMEQQGELFEKLNLDSRKILLKRENIDAISKAITHFIFINGPIEDMEQPNFVFNFTVPRNLR